MENNTTSSELADSTDEVVVSAKKATQKLIAFWKCAVFPYVMWGDVYIKQDDNVLIKGADFSFYVKPMFVMPKKNGDKLKESIIKHALKHEQDKIMLQVKATDQINSCIKEHRDKHE